MEMQQTEQMAQALIKDMGGHGLNYDQMLNVVQMAYCKINFFAQEEKKEPKKRPVKRVKKAIITKPKKMPQKDQDKRKGVRQQKAEILHYWKTTHDNTAANVAKHFGICEQVVHRVINEHIKKIKFVKNEMAKRNI